MNARKTASLFISTVLFPFNLEQKRMFSQKPLRNIKRQEAISIPDLPDKKLCFLLGSPRSGTTLLSSCLSLNKKIYAPQELHVAYADTAQKIYDLYPQDRAQMSLFTGFINALEEVSPNTKRSEALSTWYKMVNQDIPLEQMYSYLHHHSGQRIVVDKSPTLPLAAQSRSVIENLLPKKPSFIHLYRHPLSVIQSSISTFTGIQLKLFVGSFSNPVLYPDYAQQFKEAFEESPFRFFETLWRIQNKAIFDLLEKVPESNKCQVAFENILKSPDTTLQTICQALGTNYDPTMVQIEKARQIQYSPWDIIKMNLKGDYFVGDPNLVWSPKAVKSINPKRADSYKSLAHQWNQLTPETQELALKLGYEAPE